MPPLNRGKRPISVLDENQTVVQKTAHINTVNWRNLTLLEVGGSSHTLITPSPSTTLTQSQPPQMFNMGYPGLFQPFIEHGFASQPMMSNPMSFIVADEARNDPPRIISMQLPPT